MSLRERASELTNRAWSAAAGDRANRLTERLGRVRDGDPWFDTRGLDAVRRRPVDGESIERRRGVAFAGLLVAALWYPFLAGVGVVGCATAAVGVGAVRGRFYCNHLCPRGGLLDGYVRLFSRGKRTPDWFKHPLTRAAVALVAFGLLGTGLYTSWHRGGSLGVPFLTMLGVSTLVAVGLGVVYHQRAWCQICPAGTLSHASTPTPAKIAAP